MSRKIVVEIEVTPEEGEALLRMAERGYLPERLSHRHAEQGIQALRSGLVLANAVAVAKRSRAK